MEVILREDVDKVGARGALVKVADWLRPQLSPAAQAGCAGHRLQQENRRAGTRSLRSPRSQSRIRIARSGQAACRRDS